MYYIIFANIQFIGPLCMIIYLYTRISARLISSTRPGVMRPGQRRRLYRWARGQHLNTTLLKCNICTMKYIFLFFLHGILVHENILKDQKICHNLVHDDSDVFLLLGPSSLCQYFYVYSTTNWGTNQNMECYA